MARAAAAAVALGRRGAGGIRELHRQGVTEGLKRDARVGAATLSYLLDAAAADAGALADETGAEAFAELLDAVPGRAGALAKAADTCAQALLEALPLLQDAAGQVVDALVTHAVAAPQAQAVPCRVEHVAALCRARARSSARTTPCPFTRRRWRRRTAASCVLGATSLRSTTL